MFLNCCCFYGDKLELNDLMNRIVSGGGVTTCDLFEHVGIQLEF